MNLDAMLAQSRTDGVDDSDNLPFYLPPRQGSSPTGVLLVHGFTASPWEMRWFGEGLSRHGCACLGVRLPGHGTTAEDLSTRSRKEWLATVAQGYEMLAGECTEVFGVGLSTGALLLSALATQRPMAGLVLLSPFVRLKHPLVRAAGLIARIHPFEERPLAAEMERYYYRRRPLHGVHELVRLLDEVALLLPTLQLPALVVGGGGDLTVPAGSARALYERLGSRSKTFHLLGPAAPHVLTTVENPCRDRVLTLTRNFILDRLPHPPPSSASTAPGPGRQSPPTARSCQ